MSKRILFCIENLHHGGINKALENLISLFDKTQYEITIFVVNRETGPYENIFKEYIRHPSDHLLTNLCTNYRKHHGIKKFSLIILKCLRKFLNKLGFDILQMRLNSWAQIISREKYDCVIAYSEGYITSFVSKIKAFKAAWIHIDYKRHLMYEYDPNEKIYYGKYDKIIIPSIFSAKSFNDVLPQYHDKLIVIPNLIDSNGIRARSTIQPHTTINTINGTHIFSIISVGRICYEKRFYEIPQIASLLLDRGMDFRWYILGEGSDIETKTLVDAISKHNVSTNVILLGKKDNPYPYIKQCDILVSTSWSETFSYVIFEAKSLGVPIVCADFGTAPEILNDSEGIICSINDMPQTIFELYSDSNKLSNYKSYLTHYNYDNEVILNKLYASLNH